MLAVRMLRGPGAVYLLTILANASPLPLQVLPSIPGYIPVYIRHGDEPLIEINPALAEAFHEDVLDVPKNLPLDNGADLSIDEIEGNGFLFGSKKNGVSKVRKAENGTRATVDGYEKTTEKDAGVGPSKILPYQSQDKRYLRNGQERRKSGSKSRDPPVKVSPLSEAEKEKLEKFQLSLEKLDRQENSHQEHPDRSKLSRDFSPVVSLADAPLRARTSAPRARLASARRNDSSVHRKREPPTKVEEPVRVYSNVRKLLPADVREGTIVQETTAKMETEKPRRDDRTDR